MRKRSPKSESMPRNWARQALLKNFDFGQSQRSMVNSQWLGCWRYSRAYVAGRDTGRHVWHVGAHEAHVSACEARGGAWWSVVSCGARARETKISAVAWGHVWGGFWPFLVGFCSGLYVLSLYAFALAVGWAEQWDLRVAGTVGVTVVTRF